MARVMLAPLPLALGVAASLATFAGGLATLRFRNQLSLITGLSAGVVLGVALLELIPESLEMAPPGEGGQVVLTRVAIGLGAYLLLDRLLSMLSAAGARLRRQIGPASLTLHSLLDGVGIGLAFQLSNGVGWGVAIAVLSHDLADGVNVVTLSLNGDDRRGARRWLVANGLAPITGVLIGQVVPIPPTALIPAMALIAGAFLSIGATELLPRSYRMNRRISTIFSSLAGFALVFAGTQIHI